MHPYAIHATVSKSHRLVIDLPADFPEGEVEIVLRPIAPTAPDNEKHALGQRLRELRQKSLDAGMTPLDWDGIRREVQERRGGIDNA